MLTAILASQASAHRVLKVGTHEGTCCRDMSRGRISCAVHKKGHVAGTGFLKVSGLFFSSVAGTCCMNSSHEATDVFRCSIAATCSPNSN